MHSFTAVRRAMIVPAVLVLTLVASATALAAGSTATTGAGGVSSRSVIVAGTCTLAARGSGVARLAGSYVLVGSMDGGSLRIVGATAFTTIRVTGWTSKTRYADGTLLYRGVHGSFFIAGRTLRTTITSTGMRFVATGHGRVLLVGRGQYWVNGHGPRPWSTAGIEPAF
jgi:hypothetical protein